MNRSGWMNLLLGCLPHSLSLSHSADLQSLVLRSWSGFRGVYNALVSCIYLIDVWTCWYYKIATSSDERRESRSESSVASSPSICGQLWVHWGVAGHACGGNRSKIGAGNAIASIDVFSVWIAVRAGRLIRRGGLGKALPQDCQGVSLLSQLQCCLPA